MTPRACALGSGVAAPGTAAVPLAVPSRFLCGVRTGSPLRPAPPRTADVRADRPRCLPWSSALLCANSFRPSAEIVTSRGGASSCCPPAPGLADKPQPEANVCLLRRREGGGSGLRRGPRAGSHLSRQPHARQGSGSSSQPLGEWGRLPALTARQGPGTPPSRPVSASVALPGGSGNLTALARLRRLLPWLDTFRGG